MTIVSSLKKLFLIFKIMNSKELIKDKINKDWGNESQFLVCMSILNYLLRVPPEQLSHITYGSLRKVVDRKFDDTELLIAIQYLSGDHIKLLEVKFELIDDNEDNFPLPDSEMILARETGKLIHPEKGVIVDNYEDKVFMYFTPSSLVASINN